MKMEGKKKIMNYYFVCKSATIHKFGIRKIYGK